ncbi:transcription repressor OFP12 [Ricinus communis]|uniref:Transcription repressor n=1 Tax=Ricinus communis TaxID=3988 RepID=B9RTR1_RICCO|nr:transcription repressor OFP12 [Ricinus communis]EEF45293.1 conserved hypothetical protein [Ricinus communis]|eukprot:XP_015573465.1 transcription repressor OFP12 [Ricinus communis]
MSIFFWKNLLKCLPTTTASSNALNSEQEHTHLLPPPTVSTTTTIATDSSTASIMIKNVNSLYDLSSASTSKSLSTPSTYSFSSSSSGSDVDSPPDFAAIFASQRFFFSSPGRSNSIIESPETPSAEPQTPLNGGVAVKKYSPDPYADFRQSMLEMIEARKPRDVKADWDYLHELLSCYLNLNPKQTHKFIISAFADIVICLLTSSSSESDTLQKPEGRRRQHNVSSWSVQ